MKPEQTEPEVTMSIHLHIPVSLKERYKKYCYDREISMSQMVTYMMVDTMDEADEDKINYLINKG
jgi:hypothetical protein